MKVKLQNANNEKSIFLLRNDPILGPVRYWNLLHVIMFYTGLDFIPRVIPCSFREMAALQYWLIIDREQIPDLRASESTGKHL